MRKSYPGWATREQLAQKRNKNYGSPQYSQREIDYAQNFFEYSKAKFPGQNKNKTWEDCKENWVSALHRAIVGKDAIGTFEEVTAALEWAKKDTRFYAKNIRSLGGLWKRWGKRDGGEGIYAIYRLMDDYNAAMSCKQEATSWFQIVQKENGLVLSSVQNIKKVVRWTLAHSPKQVDDLGQMVQTLTKRLVEIKDWLDDCNSQLPENAQNRWYETSDYLWKAADFTNVYLQFDTDEEFMCAAQKWFQGMCDWADSGIKSFNAGFMKPDKILAWR